MLEQGERRLTAKEKFYAQVAKQVAKQELPNRDFNAETEMLRLGARVKAERIAGYFLGEPNKKLSNKSTLRYGEKGRLAFNISGSGVGTWYDFGKGCGGDIFSFVMDQKSCDFKEAASFLTDFLGINPQYSQNQILANENQTKDKFDDFFKSEQGAR